MTKLKNGKEVMKDGVTAGFAIFTLNVASAASAENAYSLLQELFCFPSSQSVLILPPVDTCRCLYHHCELLSEDAQA